MTSSTVCACSEVIFLACGLVRTRNLTVEKSGALGLVLQQAVNKMVPASGKILTLQDLKVKKKV
jgi:hypothetical protein